MSHDDTEMNGAEIEADDTEAAVEAEIEQPAVLLPVFDPYWIIKIAADPKAAEARMRAARRVEAADAKRKARLDAREAKITAAEAAFAEYEQRTRAELDARAVKVREAEVAFANRQDSHEESLVEREARIRKLEDRWKFVAEESDVVSGFRMAEFSALMKARAAYGIGRDSGIDEVAAEMATKEFPPRIVRHDPQGAEFAPHTSITRSEEPGPPVAVRVRPSRRSNRPEATS